MPTTTETHWECDGCGRLATTSGTGDLPAGWWWLRARQSSKQFEATVYVCSEACAGPGLTHWWTRVMAPQVPVWQAALSASEAAGDVDHLPGGGVINRGLVDYLTLEQRES